MSKVAKIKTCLNFNYCTIFKVIFVLASFQISRGTGHKIGDDPYRRGAILDSRERFRLEWTVDQNQIIFNVTVQTKGWILLGLANNAEERTGRDVVIGGVWQNGRAYLSDFHTGRFNDRLQKDINPDYNLQGSWESSTGHTFLSFSRELDTCDHQDYPITENRVTLIWAYGNEDSEDGPGKNNGRRFIVDQGSYDVYLLDPEYAPRVTHHNLFDNVPRLTGSEAPITQVWTIPRRMRLPRNETSYVCSVHKAPSLQRKHHITGFDVRFADDLSESHVHHLIVHRCQAPRGTTPSSLFESAVQAGQEQSCFSLTRPAVGSIPTHFCSQLYAVWALGGRAFFLPDHVGFPFGEDPEEYYLVQVHYDNPTMRTDVTVNVNLDFFYTRRLRPNDGGIMGVGHSVPGLPEAMLIPPQTTNARIFGHCGGECSRRILPPEGITLVSAFLHSHTSGKQLRLHHFRGNEELPWILYDDNYSNEFQQVRALPRGEVQIYPGDHLVMDCTYDNTWTNGTVIGGFRTSQEMCLSYIYYYTMIPDYSYCRSELVSPSQRQRFLGVNNVTWFESEIDWVAMPPSPGFLVGRTVTDISDNYIEWDEEARRDLREFQEQHQHTEQCNRDLFSRDPAETEQVLQSFPESSNGLVIRGTVAANINTPNDYAGPVEYPRATIPYEIQVNRCLSRGYFDKRVN